MTALNVGDVAAGSSIQLPFNTYNSSGASANRATAGSVKIYKDGSTTERSSTAGIVDNGTTGYDSITGLNLVTIDLSDNTDPGFYAAGHNYHVMVSGAVVDSQSVNPWIGDFSIQNRPVYVSPGTGTGQINLSSGAVPIQSGTGAGQLDFTSGVVKANLVQILGTLLTETAGQLAAGFKKWFNVNTPTSTMNQVTLVDTTSTVSNDVGITQAGADKAWTSAARTLTSFGTLVADTATAVWASGTRTLTSFGTLVADTATAVWSYVTRTLTSGGGATAAEVWNYLVSSAGTDITKMGGYIVSFLATINARVQSGNITVRDGFDSKGNLHVTRYATYDPVINTQLQLTVSVPIDPTLGDVFWTFKFGRSTIQYDGELISYSSSTGEATFAITTLSSTQTGALAATTINAANFALSVVLDSGVDLLQSIPYTNGLLYVKDAPNPVLP